MSWKRPVFPQVCRALESANPPSMSRSNAFNPPSMSCGAWRNPPSLSCDRPSSPQVCRTENGEIPQVCRALLRDSSRTSSSVISIGGNAKNSPAGIQNPQVCRVSGGGNPPSMSRGVNQVSGEAPEVSRIDRQDVQGVRAVQLCAAVIPPHRDVLREHEVISEQATLLRPVQVVEGRAALKGGVLGARAAQALFLRGWTVRTPPPASWRTRRLARRPDQCVHGAGAARPRASFRGCR